MAKLSNLNPNSKPKRFCAIDASTNSLAFAIFDGKEIVACGKINFSGLTTYDKVMDAARKTKAFFDHFDFEAVIIEHTVFMNSPKTAAQLAMVQGALLGAASMAGVKKIGSVSPMTWQNFIGNKKLTKEEKAGIVKNHPGKSVSWFKGEERNIRKQRTINFININYDKQLEDDDVADACAIGHWALTNWEKAFGY
jgi:Holliday junction resolvasome RuvABC endonuclease subunit